MYAPGSTSNSDLVKYEFVITVVISATMLMAAALAMDYYIKFLPGQQAEQGVPLRQMAIVHRSGWAGVDALGHLRSHTISEWGRSVTDA